MDLQEAHLVSGPVYMTHALFRLAFTAAPALTALTLPYTLTRWFVLQKARGHVSSHSLKA